MEHEAARFLRALRGRRSQVAWARRLGYRGNPITNWERGKRFPTARETLRAASYAVPDARERLLAFAPGVALGALDDPQTLAAWLAALAAGVKQGDLAARCGVSRYAIRRWLTGRAEPRLPDFFRLLDAISGRLPEWVAAFIPIEQIPQLNQRHAKVQAAKRIAFDAPWSEAILRLLETRDFAALPRHDPASVATPLGISEGEATRCLTLLVDSGIINRSRGKYSVGTAESVDTRGGRAALLRLKHHWSSVATQQLQTPAHDTDLHAYNVISLSNQDLSRVRELLRATFREIRSLVAASEPAETVALVNLQLVGLIRG